VYDERTPDLFTDILRQVTFVQLARFICVSGLYFFFALTKLGNCSAADVNGEPGGGGGLIIPSSGGRGGAPGTDDWPGNGGGGGGPQPGGRGGGTGGKLPTDSGAPPEPSDDSIAAPTPWDIYNQIMYTQHTSEMWI